MKPGPEDGDRVRLLGENGSVVATGAWRDGRIWWDGTDGGCLNLPWPEGVAMQPPPLKYRRYQPPDLEAP